MLPHSVDTLRPAQTWKYQRVVIHVLFTSLCLAEEAGKYGRKRDLKCNGSLRIAIEKRMRGGENKEDSPPSIQPPYITFLYLNRLLFDFRLLHFNIAFSIFIHQLLAFISSSSVSLSVSVFSLSPWPVFLNIQTSSLSRTHQYAIQLPSYTHKVSRILVILIQYCVYSSFLSLSTAGSIWDRKLLSCFTPHPPNNYSPI